MLTKTLIAFVVITSAKVLCQEYSYEAEERAPRYIASASDARPTPVPILKQVNRHNEDGSYTYGFEAADGSFKIETKLPDGDVRGKYGYKDDTGKLRVIEYGANKHGFQPSGEGITVAPPNLVDETSQEAEEEAPLQYQQIKLKRPKYKLQPVQSIDYDYQEQAPVQQPTPRPRQSVGLGAFRTQSVDLGAYKQQPAYVEQGNSAGYRQQFEQPINYGPRPHKQSVFTDASPVQEETTLFRPAPQFKQNLNFRAPLNNIPYEQPTARPIQYTQAVNFGGNQEQTHLQPQQNYYQPQQPQPPQVYNQPQKPFNMLDQLIKEYGLPQGGAAPLHDITFGSY